MKKVSPVLQHGAIGFFFPLVMSIGLPFFKGTVLANILGGLQGSVPPTFFVIDFLYNALFALCFITLIWLVRACQENRTVTLSLSIGLAVNALALGVLLRFPPALAPSLLSSLTLWSITVAAYVLLSLVLWIGYWRARP